MPPRLERWPGTTSRSVRALGLLAPQSGRFHVRREDQGAVLLAPGSLLRVRSGPGLEIWSSDPEGQALCWHAEPDWARAILGASHGGEDTAVRGDQRVMIDPPSSGLARRASLLMREAWLDQPLDPAGIGAAQRSLALLEILFSEPPRGGCAEGRPGRRQGDLVRLLCQTDPCAPDWSLGALAARLGVSERHASRLFRQEMGVSFRSYTNRGRVERAKKLLATTNESVADVGAQAGWGATSQFHAAFRNATGMTPAAYRGAHRSARRQRMPSHPGPATPLGFAD